MQNAVGRRYTRGVPACCGNHPKPVPFPMDQACLDACVDPEDRTMRRMMGITLLATAMAPPSLAQAQSTPPVPTQPPPSGKSESQVPPGRIQVRLRVFWATAEASATASSRPCLGHYHI